MTGVDGAIYVFDTNTWCQFGHYYRPTFDPVWEMLDEYVEQGRIISVAEVREEIEVRNGKKDLLEWVEANGDVFLSPTAADYRAVKRILSFPHFQQLVDAKERLTGGPSADPFVIAAAMVRGACVVSQEASKPNGAKIPNVCAHFKIGCIKLEEFLEVEGWKFRR
jgi:hypothetical protein